MVLITAIFMMELAIIIILTSLQLFTLIFSWKIGKILGTTTFWAFIMAGFAVILGRRVIDLILLFELIPQNPLIQSVDRIYIPMLFWSFIFIGVSILYSKLKNNKLKRKSK